MRALSVVGSFALLSSLAVVLDWVARTQRPGDLSVPWMMVVFSFAFAITAAFAVWTAGSLGLPSFLLLAPISGRARWARFGVFGVGTGLLIYFTNKMYLTTAGAPLQPTPVYELENHLQVFALSARAAFSEETMFRLFAIPFLVSVGMRFYGWRPSFGFESGPSAPPREPVQVPRRLLLVALLVSAAMFGLAHTTNPLAATAFGVVLGIAYLRGGWESAVTAHFLGNYLLFAFLYL
jgi:membrane protease YdiL (CAAX protease family)